MRRDSPAPIAILLLALIALPFAAGLVHAGMVTSVNQSAAFVRTQSRNAATGIDGVYYNPAGLTKLGDGWYISLSNQIVFRDGEVESDYAYLSDAPSTVFPAEADDGFSPGLYAVFKIDRWALSTGVYPILGVGGADYGRGLPVFEMVFADLVPALQPLYGVTGYSLNGSFEETSSNYAYQLGVSYEVNSTLSLFGGGRLVTVDKTLRGGVSDISVNPTAGYDGSYRPADEFASAEAASLGGVAGQLSAAAAQMQALITMGAGSYTLAQVQNLGYISSAAKAQYEAALHSLGFSSAQVATMSINQIKTYFSSASTHFAGNAALMNGISVLTQDRAVEVKQTGTGFAPILGVNLTFDPKWTVGLKYEFATKLELENDTKTDGFGSFLDGAKVRNDLPAQLSLGVSYAGRPGLVLSSGVNYYFDRDADYGRVNAAGEEVENSEAIDANCFELAAGVEYTVNDRLLLSSGYMFGRTGLKEEYQSLTGFSLDSHAFGFGGQYLITPDIALNLGCSFILYRGEEKERLRYQVIPVVPPYNSGLGEPEPTVVTDEYSKSDVILAVGIDYSIRR